ncbi:MAG: helix-turn-helix transcriptional regulator [Acidobacteriota bacterium]
MPIFFCKMPTYRPTVHQLRRLFIATSWYAKSRLPPGLARRGRAEILSRRPRLHGYAIMGVIHDISEEVLRAEEGTPYPALHRMEKAGWVRAEWIVKDTGRQARVYELTAAGKK